MSSLRVVGSEAVAKQTSTLIFLHGLGDSGHSWWNLLEPIIPSHMKLVCPTSHVRPVTINGGQQMPAWMDLVTMDILSHENSTGIEDSAKGIHDIINGEITKGISTNRILLGGFSQGGAVALFSSFTFKQTLAGVIGLSCWLPLFDNFPNYKISADLPIFLGHGDADSVVPHKAGEQSFTKLKQHLKDVTFQTYKDMDHSFIEDELEDIKKFIKKCVQ